MDGEVVERWLPVPGYEGLYEVSDQGRVKSFPRLTQTKELILKPRSNRGYPTVSLSSVKHGKQSASIHCLVMYAFVGPRPPRMQINHINGNKGDARLINLEYVTQSENIRHSVLVLGNKYGTKTPHGEENRNAKLSQADVINIVKAYQSGATARALAEAYGMTQWHIEKVVHGHSWKHLEGLFVNNDAPKEHRNAKLTTANVLDIRRRRREGEQLRAIAQRYGIAITNVSMIVNRQTWKHVKDEAA